MQAAVGLGRHGSCAGVPGSDLEGGSGTAPDRGPVSLTLASVSQCLCPLRRGQGSQRGLELGVPLCTSQARPPRASGSSAVIVQGSLRRALVPTETCACGVLSQSVVILCICLLGSLIWGTGERDWPCDLASLGDLREAAQ